MLSHTCAPVCVVSCVLHMRALVFVLSCVCSGVQFAYSPLSCSTYNTGWGLPEDFGVVKGPPPRMSTGRCRCIFCGGPRKRKQERMLVHFQARRKLKRLGFQGVGGGWGRARTNSSQQKPREATKSQQPTEVTRSYKKPTETITTYSNETHENHQWRKRVVGDPLRQPNGRFSHTTKSHISSIKLAKVKSHTSPPPNRPSKAS